MLCGSRQCPLVISTQPFMACKGPLGVNSGDFSESCVRVCVCVCVRAYVCARVRLLLLNGNRFSRGFRGATWARARERPRQLFFPKWPPIWPLFKNVVDKKLNSRILTQLFFYNICPTPRTSSQTLFFQNGRQYGRHAKKKHG